MSLRPNDDLENLDSANDFALVCMTECISIGPRRTMFTLDSNPIASVNSFTYPGNRIKLDGRALEELPLGWRSTLIPSSIIYGG